MTRNDYTDWGSDVLYNPLLLNPRMVLYVIASVSLTLAGCITNPTRYMHEEVGSLCDVHKYQRDISQHRRVDKVECFKRE